ncbi:MAG: hypothetical protein ACF8PG_08755, partial [Maioricimonas sp. JB045]
MSSLATMLLLISAASAVDARITLQDGTERAGSLEAVADQEIRLGTDDGPQTLPLSEVQKISFGEADAKARPPVDAVEIKLADGSLLHASTLTASVQKTSIASPALGEASLQTSLVQSVRLATIDERVSAAWDELSARKTQNDLLVIRKGDALDFAAGPPPLPSRAPPARLGGGAALPGGRGGGAPAPGPPPGPPPPPP